MWLTDYLSGHGKHSKKDALAVEKNDGLANRTVERAFSKLCGQSEGRSLVTSQSRHTSRVGELVAPQQPKPPDSPPCQITMHPSMTSSAPRSQTSTP